MRGFLQSLSSLRHLDGFLAIFFPTTGCLDTLRRPSVAESAASCAFATRASCRVAVRSAGHRVTPRTRLHGPLWASKRSLWAHGRRWRSCAAASWVRRRAQNGRGPWHDVWSRARVAQPPTRARGGGHPAPLRRARRGAARAPPSSSTSSCGTPSSCTTPPWGRPGARCRRAAAAASPTASRARRPCATTVRPRPARTTGVHHPSHAPSTRLRGV